MAIGPPNRKARGSRGVRALAKVRFDTLPGAGLLTAPTNLHIGPRPTVEGICMSASHPSCLVCEDQALIGLALEAYLEDAGIGVVGPFGSCAEALAWIETGTPEFAVIDFTLKDGPSTRIVEVLRARGVPVVIYSGWQRRGSNVPSSYADLPWLEKPTDRDALLAALIGVAPARTSQVRI